MDALSAMATICGYKAVLIAADLLAALFPDDDDRGGHHYAGAGADLGGGVAGLQAIATARRLGAVTSAYDVRPAERNRCRASAGASSNCRSNPPTAEVARLRPRDG